VQIDPTAGNDEPGLVTDNVLLEELTEVFALLYDTCLRLAKGTVRDSMLAEEVVQEAFLAAWQHAPARFDPARGPLAVWLMTLTRPRAVDAVRRAERTRRLQRRQEAQPHQEVDDASPEELVLRRQAADRVRNGLQALPVGQQRVLLMSYWGGLTQSQIARQDGTPLGTVKTRAGAGLVRLRALLWSRSRTELSCTHLFTTWLMSWVWLRKDLARVKAPGASLFAGDRKVRRRYPRGCRGRRRRCAPRTRGWCSRR